MHIQLSYDFRIWHIAFDVDIRFVFVFACARLFFFFLKKKGTYPFDVYTSYVRCLPLSHHIAHTHIHTCTRLSIFHLFHAADCLCICYDLKFIENVFSSFVYCSLFFFISWIKSHICESYGQFCVYVKTMDYENEWQSNTILV